MKKILLTVAIIVFAVMQNYAQTKVEIERR